MGNYIFYQTRYERDGYITCSKIVNDKYGFDNNCIFLRENIIKYPFFIALTFGE